MIRDFNPDPKTAEFSGSNYAPCCMAGMVSTQCDQGHETVSVPGTPNFSGAGFEPDPTAGYSRQIPTCAAGEEGGGGGGGDPEPEVQRVFDLFLPSQTAPLTNTGIAGGESIRFQSRTNFAMLWNGVPEDTFPNAFLQKSFTARIWAKTIPLFQGEGPVFIFQAFNDVFQLRLVAWGHFDPAFFDTPLPWPPPDLVTYQLFFANADGTQHLWASKWYAAADFHRIRFWWDKDNTELGFQVDNDAPVTLNIGAQSASFEDGSLSVGHGSGFDTVGGINHFYDELGVWHDYLWTTPESTADWNGGAGLDYAGTLLAISEPPMLYYAFDAADIQPNDGSFIRASSYPYIIKDKVHE